MVSHTLLGCLSVFGAFLVHTTLGTYYTWGNFGPYLISAVRYFTLETAFDAHLYSHIIDNPYESFPSYDNEGFIQAFKPSEMAYYSNSELPPNIVPSDNKLINPNSTCKTFPNPFSSQTNRKMLFSTPDFEFINYPIGTINSTVNTLIYPKVFKNKPVKSENTFDPPASEFAKFYTQPSNVKYRSLNSPDSNKKKEITVNIPRLKDMPWILTMTTLGQGSAMPLGGFVESYLGGQLVCMIGGVFIALGVFLSQYFLSNFTALLFTYGLIYGLGIGFAYTSPLRNATTWFPSYKGLMSGIITGGFGLGALIYNQIHMRLVNQMGVNSDCCPYTKYPDECYFDDVELFNNVRKFFTPMASIYICSFIVGSSLMIPNSWWKYFKAQCNTQHTIFHTQETLDGPDNTTGYTNMQFAHQQDNHNGHEHMNTHYQPNTSSPQHTRVTPHPTNHHSSSINHQQQSVQYPQHIIDDEQQTELMNYYPLATNSRTQHTNQHTHSGIQGTNEHHISGNFNENSLTQRLNNTQICEEENNTKSPTQYSTQLTVHKHDDFSFSLKETFQTPQFYTLFIFFFINGICISFVATFWKIISAHTDNARISDQMLTLIGSIGSLSNASGRIIWGFFSDKYKFMLSIVLLSFCWCLFILLLPFTPKYGGFTYGLIVILNFFCLGGNFSLFPAAISRLYGNRNFGVIYGFFFFSQTFASFTFGLFSQNIYPAIGIELTTVVIASLTFSTGIVALLIHQFAFNLNKLNITYIS